MRFNIAVALAAAVCVVSSLTIPVRNGCSTIPTSDNYGVNSIFPSTRDDYTSLNPDELQHWTSRMVSTELQGYVKWLQLWWEKTPSGEIMPDTMPNFESLGMRGSYSYKGRMGIAMSQSIHNMVRVASGLSAEEAMSALQSLQSSRAGVSPSRQKTPRS